MRALRGLLLLLIACTLCMPALAAELRGVKLSRGATGTRAEIQLSSEASYTLLHLANPQRLVIDFKGSSARRSMPLPKAMGVVKEVRTGTPTPGDTRLVFDLGSDVKPMSPRMEARNGGHVLVVEWPDDGDDTPVAMTQPAPNAVNVPTEEMPPIKPSTMAAVADPPKVPVEQPKPVPAAQPVQDPVKEPPPVVVHKPAPPPNTIPTAQAPVRTVADVARRAAGRPLLIAIDAGHGGQDTGARGAAGSREKDITLRVALELARQVNATPGMKAYLTRDADFFIPLVRRYQLAREHKADMFVSIHADAFTNPSARGSSVFVLSRRGSSSQAARWLADQENAADLVGGVRLRDKDNTLASVLLDLSQSATQRASEEIAAQVLRGLADLGKTHKDEIERANFVVLRSPDVPSMLVETAFISNPEEERRLNQPEYQRELARAVLNGVHTYFRRQPPPGTQYAAMYGGSPAPAGKASP